MDCAITAPHCIWSDISRPLKTTLCIGMHRLSWYVLTTSVLMSVVHADVKIYRKSESLTLVPQDVATDVTHLFLESNLITTVNFDSFKLFTMLKGLDLSKNPLREIATGAFDNNPNLKSLVCQKCALEVMPTPDFGPCSSRMWAMDLRNGIVDTNVLRSLDFSQFTGLGDIKIDGIDLPNLDDIALPSSLTNIQIMNAGITQFPTINSITFPNLLKLNLNKNKLSGEMPSSWFADIPDTCIWVFLMGNRVKLPEDLPLKTGVEYINLRWNNLETIPDMLDFPNLNALTITANRIVCDQRMCWRRLWDRMRAPLAVRDDATCANPPELNGLLLSTVNPRAMGCYNGGFHGLFHGDKFPYGSIYTYIF